MKKTAIITSIFIILVLILTAAGISGQNPVQAQSGSHLDKKGVTRAGIASSPYFPFIW